MLTYIDIAIYFLQIYKRFFAEALFFCLVIINPDFSSINVVKLH